jgi:hypothetical protein
MTVQGPSDELTSFLKNLDEKKLVDLAADILTLEGHSNMKITDGPGDGQRDIHSVNREGEKQITQSKFHSNINHSMSTTEIGEITQGMLRFGYKKGLVITNSKISPPAKRDCIDLYPGLNIDFIDGIELIKRVFGNIILRSIWYDGESIDKVNYQIIIPFVVRDLEKDKPIPIINSLEGRTLEITIETRQFELSFRESWINTNIFGQYRMPTLRTMSELQPYQTRGTEVIVSGVIHLDQISSLIEESGKQILSHCRVQFPKKSHVACVLGSPFLAALSKDEVTSDSIKLERYPPVTFVCHNNMIESEESWLLPNYKDGWLLPNDIRASQASWIFWYAPKSDICLDITIIDSPPNDSGKWQLENRYNFFDRWWNESLFFLIPEKTSAKWDQCGLENPSEWFQWFEGTWLGAWYHPYMRGPLTDIPFESEDDSNNPRGSLLFNKEEFDEEMRELGERIEKIGGISIVPKKARYMISFLRGDPYPRTDIIDFRNFDLTFNLPGIPTPIDPKSRRIQFMTCWTIEGKEDIREEIELKLNSIPNRLPQEIGNNYALDYEIESFGDSDYLIIRISYLNISRYERSLDIINSIKNDIDLILANIEGELSSYILKKATKDFMMYVIGLVYVFD